ncbi:MAG: queuosine precursor transporter [Bacteroidota bacterium]
MDAHIELNRKKHNLYLILSLFFLTNALLAEAIGPKIFSFDKVWGQWFGNPRFFLETFGISLNLSAGVILWPIVFITTDIINHYFGRKGVRKITFITLALLIFAFLAFYLSAYAPPADFWLEANQKDDQGNPLNINYAYKLIYTQGMNIIIGSLIAFVLGQLLDATVYYYIRRLTKERFIWFRATISTVFSQLIDSYLILMIAFYWLSNWKLEQVIAVGTVQFIFKMIIAVLLIPFLYLAHYFIDKALKVELLPDEVKA